MTANDCVCALAMEETQHSLARAAVKDLGKQDSSQMALALMG